MTTGISPGELFVTASKFESRTLPATTSHRCTTNRSSRRTIVLLEATTSHVQHDTRTGNLYILLIVINPKFNALIKSGLLSRIETFKLYIPIWFFHRHLGLEKLHDHHPPPLIPNQKRNDPNHPSESGTIDHYMLGTIRESRYTWYVACKIVLCLYYR